MTDRERTDYELKLLDKRLRDSKTAWIGLLIIGLIYVLAWWLAYQRFAEWGIISCVVVIGFVGVAFIMGTKRAEGMTRAAFFSRGGRQMEMRSYPVDVLPDMPAVVTATGTLDAPPIPLTAPTDDADASQDGDQT